MNIFLSLNTQNEKKYISTYYKKKNLNFKMFKGL